MKSPDLWNEDDLLQLIANRQEESIQLDFKRADALQQTDGKKKMKSARMYRHLPTPRAGLLFMASQSRAANPASPAA